MELDPEFQKNPQALSLLYVAPISGDLVPLEAVATLGQDLGPLAVNHTGQLPSVTISFNLKPGVSLGDAVTQVDRSSPRRCFPPRSRRASRARRRPSSPPCRASACCW